MAKTINNLNQTVKNVAQAGANPVTPAMAEQAIRMLADTGKMRTVAAHLGVHPSDLWERINRDPDLRRAYYDAREVKAHDAIDELDEITRSVADGARNPKETDQRVKYLMWLAGKTRSFSDRSIVEHQHTHDVRLDSGEMLARLSELVQVARASAPLTLDVQDITPLEAEPD